LAAFGGGDAEVRQCRTSEVGEQDVGGLDVAVQDAEPVRRLDGAGDLDRHLEGAAQR
jgi:hypothetical protein